MKSGGSSKPKSILKHSSSRKSHREDEKRAGDSNRSAVPYQIYKEPGDQGYQIRFVNFFSAWFWLIKYSMIIFCDILHLYEVY